MVKKANNILIKLIKLGIVAFAIILAILGVKIAADFELSELKQMLIQDTQNQTNQLNFKISKVEDSVNNLSLFIKGSFDISKAKDANYLKSYHSILEPVTREFANNVQENISTYVYFAPELTGKVYGSWLVKDQQTNKFTPYALGHLYEFYPNNPDFKWYYDPIKKRKAIWSDLYYDKDIKKQMISYVAPVYKDGVLLGVVGMDITLHQFGVELSKMESPSSGSAFIIDERYNMFADANTLSDVSSIITKNEFISYTHKEKDSLSPNIGFVDNLIRNKYIIYSKLKSGFILVKAVPSPGLFKKLALHFFIVLGIIIFIMIVADINNLLHQPENYKQA